TIKGVEPGPIRQESRFQAMPLRLTGSGSYRGCVQFLHDLRDALHDTTIVDFRLTGTPEANASLITFDLNLCWYASPTVASVQGSDANANGKKAQDLCRARRHGMGGVGDRCDVL